MVQLRVLAVIGSTNKDSVTGQVVRHVAERLRTAGCHLDILDFAREPLALFNPDSAYAAEYYPALKARVELADVYLLGTPDYHGSISSALKNFFDHFWQEFAGKLFATVVSSFEKGLTVTDQIRTVARQCYAWSLPYGVSFSDKVDVKDGRIIGEQFQARLEMFAHDIKVYGTVLAEQRLKDLAGTEPTFMARYRARQ
ncbi:MAG: NAD(P)H-dependent oxidoreductase [Verrucomicrobiota bacterium]|nr:NAD(P)H-dependent oxidoreductase [Verrucomicrobiota bacterium]